MPFENWNVCLRFKEAGHLKCPDSKGESRTNYTATFGQSSTRHADTLPQISRAGQTRRENIYHCPGARASSLDSCLFFTSYCCVRSVQILQIQFEYGQAITTYFAHAKWPGNYICWLRNTDKRQETHLSLSLSLLSLSLVINISIDFTF